MSDKSQIESMDFQEFYLNQAFFFDNDDNIEYINPHFLFIQDRRKGGGELISIRKAITTIRKFVKKGELDKLYNQDFINRVEKSYKQYMSQIRYHIGQSYQ